MGAKQIHPGRIGHYTKCTVFCSGASLYYEPENKVAPSLLKINNFSSICDPTTSHFSTIPHLPVCISDPPVVSISSNRFLAIGGLIQHAEGCANVQMFSASTSSWTTTSPLPMPSFWHSAAALEDRVVVTGGFLSCTTWILSPDLSRWTKGPDINKTQQRTLHGSTSCCGSIFITGGGGDDGGDQQNAVTSTERLDPREPRWETVQNASLTTTRAFLRNSGLASVDDKALFAVGGNSGFATAEMFDIVAGHGWQNVNIPETLAKMYRVQCVALPNSKVLLLGENANNKTNFVSAIYDISTNNWSNGPSVPYKTGTLAISLK